MAEGSGKETSWPCTSLFCFKTYTGLSHWSKSDFLQTSLLRCLIESRCVGFVGPSTLPSQATADRSQKFYWNMELSSVPNTRVRRVCSFLHRPHSTYGLRPTWALTQGSSIYYSPYPDLAISELHLHGVSPSCTRFAICPRLGFISVDR
jgi:hypothetical protein